jgi:hypothetical protein
MTGRRRVLVTLLFALSACAAGGVPRAEMKSAFDIQYGLVDEVEQLQAESAAGSAALAGGVVGALVSKKHRLAGAAGGAAGAGLLTMLAEGDRRVFAYTIRLDSGRTVKVVVDHGDLAVGQCVAFELGRSANVRVVSPGHCQQASRVASRSEDVQGRAQDDAEACHAAKQAVLAATTEEQTALWEHKARVLCGH